MPSSLLSADLKSVMTGAARIDVAVKAPNSACKGQIQKAMLKGFHVYLLCHEWITNAEALKQGRATTVPG